MKRKSWGKGTNKSMDKVVNISISEDDANYEDAQSQMFNRQSKRFTQ